MSSAMHDALAEERQRAARALLERGVLLAGDPLFVLARRHKEELAADFRDRLGYALQISTHTARLYKRVLLSEARPLTLPPRSATDAKRSIDERRVLDARRCLMAALIGAVLERRTLWTQVPLTELAEEVAREGRALELEVDWKRSADRAALIDAVAWLSGLGVLALRHGAEGAFGEGVEEALEAYYDIDRPRLAGVLADPIRIAGATDTYDLDPPAGTEPNRARAQRLTRRLVEDPAVYLEDLSEEDRQYFLGQRGPLERRAAEISGLQVERRREGSALIASGRGLSDRPFPARSHRKQLALLLVAEMCAIDGERRAALSDEERELPLAFAHERVLELVAMLLARHREHWGWSVEDPAEARAAADGALGLLEELMLVRREPHGVLLRPAAFRYRSVTVKLADQPELFQEDAAP
ncbi:MAG TPA: TIGR02678 family protein [Solirubrobacteraceae bacterium]|nr:TIGR02678 family protein [Solirubrobacteraceae bacterium]